MAQKAGKVPALKLTQGGAPLEWHIIGTDAYVHPTIPSPVGGPGECTLERAKELGADKGAAVKLVYVTERQAEEGRKARDEARSAGVSAAREARRQGKRATAEEADRVATEAAVAAGGKE